MIGDRELDRGAAQLLHECLGVTERDVLLILTDAETAGLADRIAAVGRSITRSVIEVLPSLNLDYGRAYARIEQVVQTLRPSVVVFAARDDEDLLAWDPRYWDLLSEIGARNAQMPALDAHALGVGMGMDYRDVARFTELVTARLTGAQEVAITNALGTDITFRCDPARPWTPFTGRYLSKGEGGRLPQGETFCSPVEATGRIAASVLGYPFNASTGLLVDPVIFEIRDSRLISLDHPDPDLAERLRQWFTRDPDAGRIGELALGTNLGCTTISGNLLFDENVPGCHIALGHPFGELTGACWSSGVHVDLVVDRPTIRVDNQVILESGDYILSHLTHTKGTPA